MIIRFKEVSKWFGESQVLRDVSFGVNHGEKVTIIGRSGSGKSTLLRCINGLERITSGEIWVEGENVAHRRHLTQLRQKVGFVFQSYNLFPHLNVRKNIALGLRHAKRHPRELTDEIVRDVLQKVHLSEKIEAFPFELSGGQRQRVAIARALAMDPVILLLDEITSALDPELIGEVLDTLREISRLGKTMLIVTHEIDFAREISDRMIFFDAGSIVEDGPPERLIRNPRSSRTRDFLSRVTKLTAEDAEKARIHDG